MRSVKMHDERSVELSSFERTLIVCLMEPILTWNNKERLQELYDTMGAGSKGDDSGIDHEEYKVQMKKMLRELCKRLGF